MNYLYYTMLLKIHIYQEIYLTYLYANTSTLLSNQPKMEYYELITML